MEKIAWNTILKNKNDLFHYAVSLCDASILVVVFITLSGHNAKS